MALTTAATQKYLQPFEGATGWGVFLPGDAPPQFATKSKSDSRRRGVKGGAPNAAS
jgi:hypothetical protein